MKQRTRSRPMPPRPASERGAVLIIGMVLLAVLSVLGVTGMSTSLLDLSMMLNSREALNAQEVTESALRAALNSEAPLSLNDDTEPGQEVRPPVTFELGESGGVAAVATTRYVGASNAVPVGWEHGDAAAVHFRVDSDSVVTRRGAGESQSAGFYIMAPAP